MPNLIEKVLLEYIKGVSKIVGDELDKIILFGSYAKNTQNQNGEISDIDIMILINTEESRIKEIEDKILNYSYDIDLKYNVLLSPIVETLNNYNNRLTFIPFYQNVEKEGVVLNV